MPKDSSSSPQFDVIIIGGGPGGATAALVLARAGYKTVVLEKGVFPRFHIGESILPQNYPLIQELGLEDALQRLPHVPKYGAEFVMGDDPASAITFTFEHGLLPGSRTFNIERSFFDEMLLNAAKEARADVRQNTAVDSIVRLNDGDVAVEVDGTEITGRYLLDASGHGTVVGRHLGIRKNFSEDLKKVAYFSQFENVHRLPGIATGHVTGIMCVEGWFWIIGLNEKMTSVGFVTRPGFAKSINVPPNRLLAWAIARCPVARHRMRDVVGIETNDVIADFSYRCEPAAGPGYFLVGDAAAFLDPIFSTGVTMAMKGGMRAAQLAMAVIEEKIPAKKARSQYIRYIKGSTKIFWRLIRGYYQHSFRELFLNGTGPLKVHNAVISVLAGNVFPRPPWCLRWRLNVFFLCMQLNKVIPMVPRRKPFSLLSQTPVELSMSVMSGMKTPVA